MTLSRRGLMELPSSLTNDSKAQRTSPIVSTGIGSGPLLSPGAIKVA